MRQIDRCQLDMLIRVRSFGANHGQLFPNTSPASDAFVTIGAEIDQLEALDMAERSAKQAASAARKQAARKALVQTLTRAASTARVLATANAAIDAQVDIPLPAEDLPLLTVARQFAARAAPWAEPFAVHGIPIKEVEDRIAAFEQALQERGIGRDARVKVRAEIDASLARAKEAVAVLDVTVANCLAADPVALTAWKHDRRIVYPGRQRHGSAAAAPAAGPAPTVDGPAPPANVAPATAA